MLKREGDWPFKSGAAGVYPRPPLARARKVDEAAPAPSQAAIGDRNYAVPTWPRSPDARVAARGTAFPPRRIGGAEQRMLW
jgi:hypothetical protein